MINFWKLHAFSLATTLAVVYNLCAIFDTLFHLMGFSPSFRLPVHGRSMLVPSAS
jgi:hypothetical protein